MSFPWFCLIACHSECCVLNMASIPDKDIPTKALVVAEAGGPFVLGDVILDEVRPDEVLVEMKYTGLCHTVGLPGP